MGHSNKLDELEVLFLMAITRFKYSFYVIDKGNSMYVTSYTTGEKDMYGQEFTNSVQQNAQRTSFQYDGDLSQYYEWKVSLRVGNGYVTCYF